MTAVILVTQRSSRVWFLQLFRFHFCCWSITSQRICFGKPFSSIRLNSSYLYRACLVRLKIENKCMVFHLLSVFSVMLQAPGKQMKSVLFTPHPHRLALASGQFPFASWLDEYLLKVVERMARNLVIRPIILVISEDVSESQGLLYEDRAEALVCELLNNLPQKLFVLLLSDSVERASRNTDWGEAISQPLWPCASRPRWALTPSSIKWK